LISNKGHHSYLATTCKQFGAVVLHTCLQHALVRLVLRYDCQCEVTISRCLIINAIQMWIGATTPTRTVQCGVALQAGVLLNNS